MAELTIEALAGMSDQEVTDLQARLEKRLEAGAPYGEGENPAGIEAQLKMVKKEARRRKSRESDPDLKEVRIRALKVPNPQFLIDRMKKGQEALVLSGASHETLAGETFILVNEIIKEGEPPLAFARVTFSQQDQPIRNVSALGNRKSSVDPLMLREFQARKGPLFVLKFKLLKAFATPKKLPQSPPGRFSSFINFEESELEEAFHLRDTHWVPVPESGTCPSTHPTKLKFPGTDTMRCFTPSAADSIRSQEQERPSLKAQTYVLSKERFKTVADANKWMDDNDVPRTKVDEKEDTFRYRQFSPDRCQEGSQRTTRITDGVQIVGCRLKPEFREQADQPKSKKGLTVEQSLKTVIEQGRKFSQEEANFQERASDPAVVCGVCRFYLRDPSSEIGRCQVVDGPIPWFATSDLYISADAEARAVLGSEHEDDGQDTA